MARYLQLAGVSPVFGVARCAAKAQFARLILLLFRAVALDEPRNESRPTGLMVRPEAEASFAVEVFVKQNQILIGWTALVARLIEGYCAEKKQK